MIERDNLSSLEKAIIQTVAYFDIFKFPLTLVEIWKWLYQGKNVRYKMQDVKISDIQEALEKSEKLKEVIECKWGFYFLKDTPHHPSTRSGGAGQANIKSRDLVEIRIERYNIAERKFKRALRVTKILASIPFVRMIAVCNNLPYNNAEEESDIDFFIIKKENRIWMTRFFCAGLMQLLRMRPTKKTARDKICLSFFATQDNLNLKDIALRPYDIYLTYWIDQIFPIYDEEGNYEKFREANKWIQEFLPNSFGVKVGFRRKVKLPFIIYKIKKILEMLHSYSFNGITEKFYKWLELKIMSRRLKEMANKDTRVIVNDKMLKFHDNDRREETRRIFEERLIELETAE